MKKRIFKKALFILLALAITLFLAACGEVGGGPAPTEKSNEEILTSTNWKSDAAESYTKFDEDGTGTVTLINGPVVDLTWEMLDSKTVKSTLFFDGVTRSQTLVITNESGAYKLVEQNGKTTYLPYDPATAAPLPAVKIWKMDYYVDEFDEPSADGYISNDAYFVGKFSNSATTDSKLHVLLVVDSEDIALMLYEYGSSLVKNSSSRNDTYYDITMKLPDGSKKDITGTMGAGVDRIWIDAEYKADVIAALSGEGSVSFYIVESDRPTTTYLFTADAANFADEYQLLQ